jgi:hypothetical protein
LPKRALIAEAVWVLWRILRRDAGAVDARLGAVRGAAVGVCHATSGDDPHPRVVEPVWHVHLGPRRIVRVFSDKLGIGLVSDVIEPGRMWSTAGPAFVASFFGTDQKQIAGFAILFAEDRECGVSALQAGARQGEPSELRIQHLGLGGTRGAKG